MIAPTMNPIDKSTKPTEPTAITPVRKTISYSGLSCFLSCPLKFRFRYIDKIQPDKVSANIALGKSVHSALSFLYSQLQNKNKPKAEQLTEVFVEHFEANEAAGIQYNGDTKEAIIETGKSLLTVYCESVKYPKKIEGVDLELKVPITNPNTGETLNNYDLLCYLDLFCDKTVVDFKTGKSSKSQWDADNDVQLSLYALAILLSEQYGYIPKLCFQVLLKLKTPRVQEISTTRNFSDFNRLFRIIQGFIKNIENPEHQYLPVRSYFCAGCEYGRECSAW